MSARAHVEEMSDSHLLSLVAQKNSEAFECLYDRFSSMLYSVAMNIVRDHSVAEDVLQEAFLLIWDKAGAYDPALGKPISWAVALTRNKALDKLRSHKRKEATLDRLEQSSVENFYVDARVEVQEKETGLALRTAMQNLPLDQRHAIELAFLQGLSHSEIAEKLNQPLGTIKARIRRGMLGLKDLLESQREIHH